jgi:hypothetical protein
MNKKQFLIRIVLVFTLSMFYVFVFSEFIDPINMHFFSFIVIFFISVIPALYILKYSKNIAVYKNKILGFKNGLSISSAILLSVFSILFILTFFEEQMTHFDLITFHVKTILITYTVCFFVTGGVDSYQLKKLRKIGGGDPWIYSLFLYLIQIGYAYLVSNLIYAGFF